MRPWQFACALILDCCYISSLGPLRMGHCMKPTRFAVPQICMYKHGRDSISQSRSGMLTCAYRKPAIGTAAAVRMLMAHLFLMAAMDSY